MLGRASRPGRTLQRSSVGMDSKRKPAAQPAGRAAPTPAAQRLQTGMASSAAFPAPPIEPMLAKIADALPSEPGFLFEPKWDGFRALVFRGADQTYLQSRDLRPLNRYFPELEKA